MTIINKTTEKHLKNLSAVCEMIRNVAYEDHELVSYVDGSFAGVVGTKYVSIFLVSHLKEMWNEGIDRDITTMFTTRKKVHKPRYMLIRIPKPDGKERATEIAVYHSTEEARKGFDENHLGANSDTDIGFVLLTTLNGKVIRTETLSGFKE